MPAVGLDDLAETRLLQLLLIKHLGQVAVLYVPVPRCSRLSALNLNLAECVSLTYETLEVKMGLMFLYRWHHSRVEA